MLLPPLLPLLHQRINIRDEYQRARQQFELGNLVQAQQEAERGYLRFRESSPDWASKFQLLEAEAMQLRGMYDRALLVLSSYRASSLYPQDEIRKLSIEGIALTRQELNAQADQKLTQAETLCRKGDYPTCGDLLCARGISQVEQGQVGEGRKSFLNALAFARTHRNRYLEANATLDLSWTALQIEHFDEAMDWSKTSYRTCLEIHAEDLREKASGNLGWAYFKLGDGERALDLLLQAEKSAARRGSIHSELGWISTAGYVYRSAGDLERASEAYLQALQLARQLNSKADMVNALEDLAHISVQAGGLDEAEAYIREADPFVHAGGNRVDALDLMIARADIAAARHQDDQAESIFRAVEHDPSAQISMKFGAEHQIATLYENENKISDADRMYRAALATFESARDELRNEDSKLPFLANASSTYEDYVHFLVTQHRPDEALRVADQSRAQTLAQGLGLTSSKSSPGAVPASRPEMIAQKTNATLLFYWLGEKQSYLWAITPRKTALFSLPSRREIARHIERYSRTLLGFTDPVERSDLDGLALYRILVAPAATLIPTGGNVIVLADGELSRLNFETLIVPSPHPHYWIEDVSLVTAPSMHLLAESQSGESFNGKLLLFGDAISPNPDYPELPMAAAEMKEIEQHFAPRNQSVYARDRATAPAYLAANPQQFAYIHFVAHGVASRTDPLDSAIILSPASATEDSFKLHAREIIRHPLHARLVTIAACYGSGSRSYAGEGPVGLAWAFLRAGAHNVIGALWEASDQSTAQLMGGLYQGLERGMPPAAALRAAKLDLLHSQREFRKPFYWAAFEIYDGL